MRWYTSSSQVYATFLAFYGGNLNSYSNYDWYSANLVVGKGAAFVAGGIDWVQSSVYPGMNP